MSSNIVSTARASPFAPRCSPLRPNSSRSSTLTRPGKPRSTLTPGYVTRYRIVSWRGALCAAPPLPTFHRRRAASSFPYRPNKESRRSAGPEPFFWREAGAVSGSDGGDGPVGSVRANSAGERMAYWPYGGERPGTNGATTPDGREKFGTYFRDSVAGVDYADQRYYSFNWTKSLPGCNRKLTRSAPPLV
jgi:hypothetical protein